MACILVNFAHNFTQAALGDCAFLFCSWHENGVPVIPIKPYSLLPFSHLALVGKILQVNPSKFTRPTVGNIPLLSSFFCARYQPPNSPGHRRPRPTVRLLTHVLCKLTHFFFHSFIATMSYSLQTSLNSLMKDWTDKYHVWGTPTRSPSRSNSR